MMKKEQLEMSFNGPAKNGPVKHHRAFRAPQRRHRAKWWFQQMRIAVDAALDWKPAPPARPEQTYLGLAPGESITRSE